MKLPEITTERMLATLTDLQRVGDDGPVTTWRAETFGMPTESVFGGQIVGQVIAAASRRDRDQPVRSIDLTFVKPVPDTGRVDYAVTTLHPGKQYACQRVEVTRIGRHGDPEVAITATVLTHRTAVGVEHGAGLPADAGSPGAGRPLDLFPVVGEHRIVGDTDLNDPRAQQTELLLWSRITDPLPDTPVVHQALLAMTSELTLIGTALLQHEGWSQADAHVGLRTAVLRHQVVFHRTFRYDDWLLFAHTSPAASGGSSYGRADVFTADGTLVASVSQEAMLRVSEPG